MTMTLHKLTAGDGYEYLTRQVAAADSTELGRQALADYYSEKGERPGVWLGRGLDGVEGVSEGEQVDAAQMKALFGAGRHPDADRIMQAAVRAGATAEEALEATQLGTPFREYTGEPSPFLVEVTRRYNAHNQRAGLPRNTAVPDEVRATIRTDVGRQTFADKYGRAPLDDRELSAHIARESRPAKQQVAGYDLTFSAVKSVSILWGTADRATSEQIQKAHDTAVRDVIAWLEDEVIFTRRGKGGALHVPVRGLLATAFTHRDSRTGDPDLHTHVAISNKVQDPRDGAWLAIDGQVLHKAVVAASERYNTTLERELNTRLGLEFAARADTVRADKRPVREVAGFTPEIVQGMSSRRAAIEAKAADLQAEFRAQHHRAPTPKETVKLYQQANLATRDRKREPHSFDELRDRWQQQLDTILEQLDNEPRPTSAGIGTGINTAAEAGVEGKLDSGRRVERFVEGILSDARRRTRTLSDHEIGDLADRVIRRVEDARARFSIDHVTAETERAIASLQLSPDRERDTVKAVLAAAMSDTVTVGLTVPDTVRDPDLLIDRTGRSLFDTPRAALRTTTRTIDAERTVVSAAQRRGGRTVPEPVVATALLEQVANGIELNPAQAQMVTEMATDDRQVQLCLAPAGSGKTTAVRVLANAWADSGGTVVGLAPSAAAATELAASIGVPTDTLAKLVWHIRNGDEPEWMRAIGPDTLLLVDEAGMASTADLAASITYVTSRGGTVRLIGDDQQLASVSAGGVLREVAAEAGAVTLSELHRFTNQTEAANTLLLRNGDVEALGFLLDNQRVRVVGEAEAAHALHAAWAADVKAGKTALMLAHSVGTVTSLNEHARAARVAAGDVDDDNTVTLRSGLPCGAGDLIVTRLNDRRTMLSSTDFVKNGDRWTVEQVRSDGSLQARHATLGRSVVLSADYVRDHVDHGYASTIHGAQGQTVDSSYALITGTESRQLLYVAMSRGRDTNAVFLPLGGDGDDHKSIHPDHLTPRTAVELLESVIRRDGAQVAALTEQRTQRDPALLLARAAERYENALRIAATETLGQERMADLTAQAAQAVTGVTDAPAWDTLAAHLAILELSGRDPITALTAAATSRELQSAVDVAAVLDWRLDATGQHSAGQGPLPWMIGIPHQLRNSDEYGSWLTARFNQVTQFKDALDHGLSEQDLEDAPEWATPVIDDPHLHADIAAWRAVHRVPDTDTSPTGPAHPSVRERAYQAMLLERYERVAGVPSVTGTLWRDLISSYPTTVLQDPWWPVLAARLDLAYAANLPVRDQLVDALARGPLPDEHAAAALWSRLAETIAPDVVGVTAITGSGAARLRPDWSSDLTQLLPDGLGRRVMADPQWPVLVASVTTATRQTGLHAPDVLAQAIDLIGADRLPRKGNTDPHRLPVSSLATVLAWRVHDLTAPPAGPGNDDLVDANAFHDDDVEDFLRKLAAEDSTTSGTVPAEGHAITPGEPEPPADWETPPDPVDELHRSDSLSDAGESTDLDRARVLELNAAAAAWFTDHYPNSPAQAHLRERFGADPADHGFLTGYAPRTPRSTGLVDHLRTQHNATDNELLAASLGQWRDGRVIDFFRDRAIIGIHDAGGDLVAFTGRDLTGYDKTPKYKNTGNTPAFNKGRVLFGLHEGITTPATSESPSRAAADRNAADKARPVLVEGPMDAIAITIAGQGSAYGVSAGGTALTDVQADLLAQITVNRNGPTVWLGLDHDSAGRRAAWTDYDKLVSRRVTPRDLVYPGKDPAESFAEHRETFTALLSPSMLDLAPGTIDGLVDQTMQVRHTPIERLQGLDHIAPKIASLPPRHWDSAITYAMDAALPGERTVDPAYLDQQTATFIDKVADAATVWDQTAPRTRPTLQPVPEQLRTLITPEKTPEQSDMAAQITRLKKISEDLRSPRAAAPSPVAPSEATRYDQQNPRHDGPTLH